MVLGATVSVTLITTESAVLVLCTVMLPWYTLAARPAGLMPTLMVLFGAEPVVPVLLNGMSQNTPFCVVVVTV